MRQKNRKILELQICHQYSSNSFLEGALISGLTHFESVTAIKAGIKYGKNLVH
jgi:hypothetical protein